MRVALIRYHETGNINPRNKSSIMKNQGVLQPLGLAFLAAGIERAGHEVKIFDCVIEHDGADELRQKILEFSCELAGIAAMTATLKSSIAAAGIAKECGCVTVLGGPHLSTYCEETFDFKEVDYGIVGDGEAAIVELIDALEGRRDFKSIKGLVYREGEKIINNGMAVINDLDSIPFPAYHLLPMEEYNPLIGHRKTALMVSARGCPFKCEFCYLASDEHIFRQMSPKRTVDCMAYFASRFGIKEIQFLDPIMTVSRKHMIELCEEIIRRNIQVAWEAKSRVDTVDYELLDLMRKAGCIRLCFGVESGNQRILNLMNKSIVLKQTEQVFRWCKDLGIETLAYFMIGYLSEDDSTMQETVNFAKKIDPDYINFAQTVAASHTALFDRAVNEGLVPGDYWKDYTRGKDVGPLPPLVENAGYWQKKAYRDFYLRPQYIFKKLKKVRSLEHLTKLINGIKGILLFK